MTYNFDPDRWYEMHYTALTTRRESGELEPAAFEAALAELDRRHAEMWHRLDGAYQIPAAAEQNMPDPSQEKSRRSNTNPRTTSG